MGRFKARELRDGTSLEEIRRTLNEIQKELAADLGTALSRSRVTELIIDGPYAARYGDVVRVAPPVLGLRVILPPKNLEQPGARVVVVVEGVAGALSVEAVDATVNGADTVTYLAGLGTVEFQLTPTGWYGWSASLNTLPLTSLAPQAADTFVGNVHGGDAAPEAVDLSILAGAGLSYGAQTFDVNGSTSITVTSDQVQRAALTGAVTAGANSNVTTLANAIVATANLALLATNAGPVFAAYVAFAAAAAGSADDVTIFSSNVPVAFTVLHTLVRVSTAIGGSTLTVRTATAGGGTAFTDSMSSAATGTIQASPGGAHSSAAGSSLFLRRSDRGVAGEVVIFGIRT